MQRDLNYARMAELADALDLESSSTRVQVRFLFRAPLRNNRIDTKNISPFYYIRLFWFFWHELKNGGNTNIGSKRFKFRRLSDIIESQLGNNILPTLRWFFGCKVWYLGPIFNLRKHYEEENYYISIKFILRDESCCVRKQDEWFY